MYFKTLVYLSGLPLVGRLFAILLPMFTTPITAIGTDFNLPNFAGEILTPSLEDTPVLDVIGGLNGASAQVTKNFEFPINTNFEHAAAAQPTITETASLTAPAAVHAVKVQQTNVVEKHHRAVDVSYDKLAGSGRLSGLNTAGAVVAEPNELDFQIAFHLRAIRRDIEFSAIRGTFALASSSAVASTTRGLNAAAVAAGNTVAASGADISKTLLDSLFVTMDDNGADFQNMGLVCSLFQKQVLGDIYGIAPRDRRIGGLDLDMIETDVGPIAIMLSKTGFQAADTVLLMDIAKVFPVFMNVPDPNGGSKGVFFVEPLSKLGASDRHQLFGHFGLNYGADWFHGTITGLSTS